MPLQEIFKIFLIDIVYLSSLQLVGLIFNHYILKQKGVNVLMNFIFGYFIVSSVTAIILTGGITIAWGVVAVLLSFVIYNNSLFPVSLSASKFGYSSKDILAIFFLFSACFISRVLVHFNYENGLPNIPFRDYVYYINLGEYFYLTGIENNLSSKNLLFEQLSYIEPYRFQDIWPMSIFLARTNIDSINIYYLILFPVNLFFVSFTMYKLINTYIPKFPFLLTIILSFLFIFYQTSDLWPYKLADMLMGLAGNPKLWLHYVILGVSFHYYVLGRFELGNALLILLLFTVPVSLAIPVFISVYILFNAIKTKTLKSFYIIFSTLLLAYFIYLILSQKLPKDIFGDDISRILLHFDFLTYLKAISYKSLLLTYILPLIIVYIPIRAFGIKLPVKSEAFIPFLGLYACGYFTYVLLHNSNDSLQFYTNISAPISGIISFLGIIFLLMEINKKILRVIGMVIFSVLLIYECFDAHIQSKHYARHNHTNMFDRSFIEYSKNNLSKVTNPVGVFYPGEGYGSTGEQFLRDPSFNMTVLMGRYFDVVNIKGDSILFDVNRYKKRDFDFKKMAINIYAMGKTKSNNLEASFIKDLNIEYMLSHKTKNELPKWLNEIIIEELIDKKSGLRLYMLGRTN